MIYSNVLFHLFPLLHTCVESAYEHKPVTFSKISSEQFSWNCSDTDWTKCRERSLMLYLWANTVNRRSYVLVCRSVDHIPVSLVVLPEALCFCSVMEHNMFIWMQHSTILIDCYSSMMRSESAIYYLFEIVHNERGFDRLKLHKCALILRTALNWAENKLLSTVKKWRYSSKM